MKITHYQLGQEMTDASYPSFAMQPLDEAMRQSLAQLHTNGYFKIVTVREGKGSYFIGLNKYEVQAPFIAFVFPRQVCSLQLEGDTAGDVIMFDESIFCAAILANELKAYNVDLHQKVNHVAYHDKPELFSEIEDILLHIQKLERPLNNIRQIELKFFTKIIILKIIDSASPHDFAGKQNQDLDDYITFRTLIEEHYKEERKVEGYCKRLAITPKKLNQLCKKYAQAGALELIHEKISFEIKKRLIFEEVMLKELAYDLGFDSQSALNKFIISKFGCSPTQLKEKLRQENTIVTPSSEISPK